MSDPDRDAAAVEEAADPLGLDAVDQERRDSRLIQGRTVKSEARNCR